MLSCLYDCFCCCCCCCCCMLLVCVHPHADDNERWSDPTEVEPRRRAAIGSAWENTTRLSFSCAIKSLPFTSTSLASRKNILFLFDVIEYKYCRARPFQVLTLHNLYWSNSIDETILSFVWYQSVKIELFYIFFWVAHTKKNYLIWMTTTTTSTNILSHVTNTIIPIIYLNFPSLSYSSYIESSILIH